MDRKGKFPGGQQELGRFLSIRPALELFAFLDIM